MLRCTIQLRDIRLRASSIRLGLQQLQHKSWNRHLCGDSDTGSICDVFRGSVQSVQPGTTLSHLALLFVRSSMNIQKYRICFAVAALLGGLLQVDAIQQAPPAGPVRGGDNLVSVAGSIVALRTNAPVPEGHILIVERTARGGIV